MPLQRFRLFAVATATVRLPTSVSHVSRLSWSYVLPQRLASRAGIASWVQRSPFILRVTPHPGAVVRARRLVTRGSWGIPDIGRLLDRNAYGEEVRSRSCASFRAWPQTGDRSSCCSSAVPFMRFGPLQHIQERQVHSPRACLTRFVPSSGFLTLLTAFSLSARPAIVSSRKRSWG